MGASGLSATFTQAGEREAGVGCPWCASPVAAGDEVAVCQRCGTVHHRGCWELRGGCASYDCAPARRDASARAASEPALKITPDDLSRAAPLPSRPAVAANYVPATTPPPRGGTSGMAKAALVCAIAAIPLFGAVTGLIAVVLGCIALGAIHKHHQRGTGMAAAAVALGMVVAVGWIAFLTLMLTQPAYLTRVSDVQLDLPDLSTLEPRLAQAMRANVLIEVSHGFAGHGVGSGVILQVREGEALLVTSRHVVDPNYGPNDTAPAPDLSRLPEPQIKLVGQDATRGRVTWVAPGGLDLALVAVPCFSAEAAAARWAANRAPRIGDAVFAVGNPRALGWTFTQGSISAFRLWRVGGRDVRMIQTHAAINPGNSGGGLYDSEGYLLGINTMTADKRESEGLSFAIALSELIELKPSALAVPPAAPPAPPATVEAEAPAEAAP